MFTGIVQAVGRLRQREALGGDARLAIAAGALDLDGVRIGDSIAVNGVCLTATRLECDGFWADVSAETLRLTTLGQLGAGAAVNLEKALTLSQPLGGHLMSGHVDGLGQLLSITPEARSIQLEFAAPPELARYIARKGSIAVDGVSLTVNEVRDRRFTVNLVPHTLQQTIFGALAPGAAVNLEVDMLARYLERLLQGDSQDQGSATISAWRRSRA